jgi:agmatine deiminase
VRLPRLPAEWEPQDAVLLAWPHEDTDWRPCLAEARASFAGLAALISRFERVLLAARDVGGARAALAHAGADLSRVRPYPVDCNDTWARDFGPITVRADGAPRLLDFVFNGWGGKFPAALDNRVTARLAALGAFGATPVRAVDFVLEGGSIDSDGRGTLLTTRACLTHPGRNPGHDAAGIESVLRAHLGAERMLWLESGHLAGDDTDAHVDMLARFAPGDVILHAACDRPDDEHHASLARMAAELGRFRAPSGRPYRLVPLPWPPAQYDEAGARLPASYANFLVINGAVLVPAYGAPPDSAARHAIGAAFPGREVFGVDCRPLIRQHGALHCVTMQIPEGVLP